MIHFPTPSSRLKFSQMSGEDLQRSDSIFESFPLHSVHLLIPSSNAHKEKYEHILLSEESTYFIVKDVTASCLVQNTFLENFAKRGLLLGMSHNARIEVENFLSISPSGKLVLSLERNIAQCLALHKEKPHGNKNKKRKDLFQTIIINLTSSELLPGKKLYQFISSELSKIDYIKFTLLLKWKSHGNVCPQSMKSYFVSQGYECIACKPKHKYSSEFSVPVPKMSFDPFDRDAFETILEWIGMQICGIEFATEEDEYFNKLTVPELSETVNRLHKCSFEGFYSKADVVPIIKEISKIFETDSSLPFIVAYLSGYQDSLVVGSGLQYFSSEDKFICVILFPSSKYWIVTLNTR